MPQRLPSPRRRARAQRVRRASSLAASLAAVLCAGLTLAACSDEPEPKRAVPVPASTKPAIHRIRHLQKADDVSPERWLASREAGRDLAEDDPSVAELRHTLELAGRAFREYPRMIANRAVQLEDMLHNDKLAERAPQLIGRLSQIAGGERYVDSFGAVCQQYFNLRTQGHSAEETIEILKRGGRVGN